MHPKQNLCIDESLVKYIQYIKNKRDRFGIKEFKYISPCYTIAMKVYCGKSVDNIFYIGNVGNNVVMELAKPYLENGRSIFVDNWCSSVKLPELLQVRYTYLVKTLLQNRKSNYKEVTKKKIVKKRKLFNVKNKIKTKIKKC